MNSRVVSCPQCEVALTNPELYNTGQLAACPGCGVPVRIDLFPAFFRETASGQPAENVLIQGESSCFYHAQKKALTVCEICGRFLCALCDVELNGQHLCPVCLERGQE